MLWPTGLLLVLALLASLPDPDAYAEVGLHTWSDRFQSALAVLMQGLGGTLDFETKRGGGLVTLFIRGNGSVSVWPLTVTLLWAGALAVGARRLRRTRPPGTGGGPEDTLRIALLSAVAVLVLGLVGQPDLDGLSVSTTPVLAALGGCALAAAVSGAVLCRDELAARLGTGAQTAMRAFGTAMRALGLSAALGGLVMFVVLAAHSDEGAGWAVGPSLLFLANMGLMALGLAWGADLEGSATDRGTQETGTFGLSDLGHAAGGWAQAGALAGGAACALILALLVARRSADRREQALAGGFFLAAFWLLSFVAGFSMKMSAGTTFGFGRTRSMDLDYGADQGELLLFGLLWTAGAVLVAAFLFRTDRPAGPGGFPGLAPGLAPGFSVPPMPQAVPGAPAAVPGAPATPPLPVTPPAPPAPFAS
ncbi:hypothetical protein, partial [Streptomyces albireticuli]